IKYLLEITAEAVGESTRQICVDRFTKRTRFLPALFGLRFRRRVGTLVPHGKGGVSALTQDEYGLNN
ncbi:MAG: hypothetical protein SVG88_11645, partial [Halobacteriales archaeon]|nr:hypothetical protein [Halobacteriales archaeon]